MQNKCKENARHGQQGKQNALHFPPPDPQNDNLCITRWGCSATLNSNQPVHLSSLAENKLTKNKTHVRAIRKSVITPFQQRRDVLTYNPPCLIVLTYNPPCENSFKLSVCQQFNVFILGSIVTKEPRTRCEQTTKDTRMGKNDFALFLHFYKGLRKPRLETTPSPAL